MKIIDLLNAKYEKRIKEGFRFVYDDIVFTVRKFGNDLRFLSHNSDCLGEKYIVEKILEDKIEVLTPDLIEEIKPLFTISNYFSEKSQNQENNLMECLEKKGFGIQYAANPLMAFDIDKENYNVSIQLELNKEKNKLLSSNIYLSVDNKKKINSEQCNQLFSELIEDLDKVKSKYEEIINLFD